MASTVEDAMLTGATTDPILAILIDLVLSSDHVGRPLFPNPLDEPILYRHFRQAVADGIESLRKIEKAKAGEG